MSDNKQSSVEWLASQILDNWNDIYAGARNIDEFIKQAKAMHKEEIIHSHLLGLIHPLEKEATEQAEDYYSETFNG